MEWSGVSGERRVKFNVNANLNLNGLVVNESRLTVNGYIGQ